MHRDFSPEYYAGLFEDLGVSTVVRLNSAHYDPRAFTDRGIHCPDGDFFIDPWRPVQRALITHGHSDHARWGHGEYLCTHQALPVIRHRLGDIRASGIAYGEARRIGGVTVSFHPAGHVPGSAQIRVERAGEVWVVSGDYKVEADGLAESFDPVPCHAFISECTFGLPVFRWQPQAQVMEDIARWWAANAAEGRVSILTAYSFGKAQRLLAGLPALGPILTHGAVEEILRFDNPLHYFRRTALVDTELSGTRIAAGDKVAMYYTSANRDEREFGPDADRFDVTRAPHPAQIGFGAGGPHFCLGANLARREIAVMFDELRRRLPDGRLEPVGPRHSWNGGQWLSGHMMLNAPRHSDHHAHPARPYPALRLPGVEEAPRLPLPLPLACMVALVPPLWRRMMRPHLARWRQPDAGVTGTEAPRVASVNDRPTEPA